MQVERSSSQINKRKRDKCIYKEKHRGCPLLGENKYTHIYIKYISV